MPKPAASKSACSNSTLAAAWRAKKILALLRPADFFLPVLRLVTAK
jgi:hypothetical protein